MTKAEFLERCQWVAEDVCEYNKGDAFKPDWMLTYGVNLLYPADHYRRKPQPKRRPFRIDEVRCGWTVDFGTNSKSQWLITSKENNLSFCCGKDHWKKPGDEGWEKWRYSPDFGATWLPWGVEEVISNS